MSAEPGWSNLLRDAKSKDPAVSRPAKEKLYAAIQARMAGQAEQKARGVQGTEGVDLLQSVFHELERKGIDADGTTELRHHVSRKLIDKRVKRVRKRGEMPMEEGHDPAEAERGDNAVMEVLRLLAELETFEPEQALAIKARMIDDPLVPIDPADPAAHRPRLLPEKRTLEEAAKLLGWSPSKIAKRFYESLRWIDQKDPELFQ